MIKELNWCQREETKASIIKVPLHFLYPPVEALSKQLTRLNSNHQYRIVYLGPRWENSVIFHKKYSNQNTYEFDHKRVNKNNNLLSDTMNHNQFYRNELYYRAFEGMNPTLNMKQELKFQSRFESGNLDCVVKVKEFQYDLFLRIDSNTRGNINWFYFSVKSPRKNKIKLNICNLTKGQTHFSKGLHPFLFSPKTQIWSQQKTINVTFQPKKLRYLFLYDKIAKLGPFYELAFEIEFEQDQQVKIAYSIPYTYSDLMSDLKMISKAAEIQVLGQSLSGLDIPVVSFGKLTEVSYKPVVVITGRIHPAQTNSSWILSKLMKQLAFSEQMDYLREKMLIVIVPMINPDGVTLGNSRTGAAGKDLNRQFKNNNHSVFPQIAAIKKLVKTIQETHIIEFYFDFHGHSRKKNVFMFGPNYNITQAEYYKCRVFPKMLSEITPMFRYYGCNYQIPFEKRGTARAVMLSQMLISFVFTVQASLGFFDEKQKKWLAFNRNKWEQFGTLFLITLKQYQEGVEQMQQFSNSKKKQKHSHEVYQKHPADKKIKRQQFKQIVKKVPKIARFYDLIASEENKAAKQGKKQKQSDASSDSHDEKQELQKQKMCEFMQMVTEFVQVQRKKKQTELSKKQKGNEFLPDLQRKNRFKMLLEKRIHQNSDYETYLFKSIQLQNKEKRSRKEIRTQNKLRIGDSKLKKQNGGIYRSDIFSHLEKRSSDIRLSKDQTAARSKDKFNLKEKQDQNYCSFLEKKSQKLNLRMFNFSKMIQSPEKIKKYQENTPFSLKNMMFNKLQKRSLEKKMKKRSCNDNQKNSQQMEGLQTPLEGKDNESDEQKSFGLILNHYNTEQMKKIQFKHKVPSNFYRIKHYQLLKKNQFKGKIFSDMRQEQDSKNRKSSIQSLESQIGCSSLSKIKKDQKRKYAKINQFPIL